MGSKNDPSNDEGNNYYQYDLKGIRDMVIM